MFRGIFTALITPFSQDQSIDFESLEKIIEHQISGGVDGLVVLGTTGESPTLNHAEHTEVLKFVYQINKGRTKLIAGAGSNATHEAISLSKEAQDLGYDAVLQVNPYYNKPTQKGLLEHFTAIAEAIDIPVILYNIAGRCGVNLETSTLLELTKIPNIVGVKEASGNLEQIKEVIEKTPNDFIVLSGDDGLTFELMKYGGNGVISVLGNLLPKQMKALTEAAQSQDWDLAQELHQVLQPLFEACFIETNPQPIKTLMAHEGFGAEVFRLPMTQVLPENKDQMIKIWKDFKKTNSIS